MSEIIVRPQELEEASSKLKEQSEQYLNAASGLKQASDNLTGAEWQGEAATAYEECVRELYTWMDEMHTVIEGFGKVLNEASAIYKAADSQAASGFQ